MVAVPPPMTPSAAPLRAELRPVADAQRLDDGGVLEGAF
eukprot:gene48168-52163_t